MTRLLLAAQAQNDVIKEVLSWHSNPVDPTAEQSTVVGRLIRKAIDDDVAVDLNELERWLRFKVETSGKCGDWMVYQNVLDRIRKGGDMSIKEVTECDRCGVTAPTPKDRGLPQGWGISPDEDCLDFCPACEKSYRLWLSKGSE